MKKSFDRFQLNGTILIPPLSMMTQRSDRTISVDAHTGATRSPLLSKGAVRG